MDKSVLDQPYVLSEEQIVFFWTSGFVKIDDVIDSELNPVLFSRKKPIS